MSFAEDADEIIAFIMGIAGVIVLLLGSYTMFIVGTDIPVDNMMLISAALIGPATGYLFGKSVPKQEKHGKE